jgi:NAD(P)-dependent dehydrogenase (short-subunit alcohol dehydrogenase family)
MAVALVSGGSSGIGRAVSLGLAEAGYDVHVCARRREALDALAAENPGIGVQTVDVTDYSAVAAWVESVGRIDVVFNNAGIAMPTTPFGELDPQDWRRMVEVNLNGAFNLAHVAYRAMQHQTPQGGRIINNGSISAYVPRPGAAHYAATKHGITGLTKAISLDGRAYNIACSQIDIGNVATDMTKDMTSGILQASGELAVEPRFDVRHVVDAVVYMAGLPIEANVQFMTIMATKMPYIGRG